MLFTRVNGKVVDTVTLPLPRPYDGLFDWNDGDAVFSDLFSPMAVSTAGSDAMGIHALYLKGLNLASVDPLFQPFLRLFADSGSGFEPVACTARRTTPGGWREEGHTDGHALTLEVSFASSSRLEAVLRAVPLSAGAGVPAMALGGSVFQGTCRVGGVMGKDLMLEVAVPARNFLGLDSGCRGSIVIACDSGMRGGFTPGDWLLSVAPDPLGLRDSSEPSDRVGYLAMPDPVSTPEGWEYRITVDWTAGGTETTATAPEKGLDPLGDADTRWLSVFESLPVPNPGGPYWRRKLAQAVACVVGCSLRDKGYGNASEDICILSSARDWSSTYFHWDHMISSAVLGLVDPEWQVSAIRFGLRHASGGRMAPGILFAFPAYGEDQNTNCCYAPVAAWTVAKSAKCSPKGADPRAIYPYLRDCNDGWFANADRDGDGIPEWVNTGHPGDNSPLYDRYAKTPGECNFGIPPFLGANLCAYLLMDTRVLLDMARNLGHTGEVKHWEEREALLQRTLIDRLWDPENLAFMDRSPEGEPVRVETFFNLLPFWAGVDLPVETARAAIRRHLLDPGRFWGEIPFPSAAYSEPTYDPVGYWRGRSWPHVYFWCTELLWKYGFHEEAERAKGVYLKLMAGYRYPVENFPTAPEKVGIPGVLNYNWGAAATAFFLLDWHRSPIE